MDKRNQSVGVSAVLACLFLAFVAMPVAFAKDDISRQLINNPNTGWTVYGPQTNKKIKDKSVQGGAALEVTLDAPGANPWDAAAQVPITGKISKGDHILAAAWLRATTASGAPADLNMRIQINAAPYTAVAEKHQAVGDQWKLYSLETVATQDCLPEACTFVVHLASAKQVIKLGPAFVVNMSKQ